MNKRIAAPHRYALPATLVVSLTLGACSNMDQRQQDTAKGAGIGAIAGAVIGAAVDGKSGAAKGAVIGGAAGAIGGNIWSRKMEEKRRAMEQATQGTGIDVSRTADNQLKLNIPSDAGFDVGRSAIKPSLRTVLDSFSSVLGNDHNTRIRVIGHTDSTGSDAINNPLSLDRAQSVRDYLAGKGVSPTRVETVGRGSHEPVADNGSEAGRAQNRRVEIFLREPEQQQG